MRVIKEKRIKTLLILLLYLSGLFFISLRYIKNRGIDSVFWFIVFFWSVICLLVHVLRKRVCPLCKIRMKMDMSVGFPPEYYYCENCKVKIKTYIKTIDSL